MQPLLTRVATGGGGGGQDVDRENEQRLEGLSGEQRTWAASDGGDGTKGAAEALKFSPFPETLRLKIGAQVVCLWNLSDSLVNGSRGVVVGYQQVRRRRLPVAAALNPVDEDTMLMISGRVMFRKKAKAWCEEREASNASST